MKSALPLVSVVITTKNEEKHIVSCLKSIKNQDYPQKKIEIIVVDNHSTDATVKLAKKYTENVFTKGPERSAQRNYGMITKSRGKYVMYVDADMELSKKVISSCVSKVTKNPDIIGLYIREIVTGDSYWSKVRRFERSFYEGTVIDCVRFIKKSAFVKVKGFDERLTGPEDWDLDKKIRNLGKVDLIKQPIYHNEAEFNLKKYLAKKSYYSKSFAKYIKKWGKDDPDVKKQFSPLYRLVVVFTEKGKWKVLLSKPYPTIGMVLLRAGVGFSYIKHLVNSEQFPNMKKQTPINISSKKKITILQIAHVTKVYGPVQSLAEFISENEHFDFYQIIHPLNKNAPPESVLLRNGKKIKEIRINTYSLLRYFLDFIITSYWLFRLPKKIDIGFGMNSFDTLPLAIFRHKINKIVFFNTDFARNRFNNKLINSIYVSIDKYCAQKADLVCCNTNRTINARINEGVNKNKLLLTPNGVNFDKIGKIKPKTKYSKSLIYIGYLSKEHGLQTVIKELPKLHLKLIVIGSGEYEQKLKNQVKKLNLDDSVTFMGNLKHQQVIDILKKFGGFGLAPYNNSSEWTYYCDPVKVKEYLACYVPVVISSRPEASETIAIEKLGFRYTNNDELKNILNKIETISENEYEEIQENISKFRNEFNLNTIYQNMWQRINQPVYIHE